MTYPPQGPQQPPYGQQPYPPQPVYRQPRQVPNMPAYQQHTTASTGLPGWMHAIYAILLIPTCGVAGIAWAIHWWMVQSKTKATTTYQPPMPPQAPRF